MHCEHHSPNSKIHKGPRKPAIPKANIAKKASGLLHKRVEADKPSTKRKKVIKSLDDVDSVLPIHDQSPPREGRRIHPPLSLKCEDHPEEEVQFYSLLINKPLCTSCLITGDYKDSETVNIKKASEVLSHKMADWIIEIQGKLDIYDLFIKKLDNRKQELIGITEGYKREILSNVAQMIKKLQAKERELIGQVEKVSIEKTHDLNHSQQNVKLQATKASKKKKGARGSLK